MSEIRVDLLRAKYLQGSGCWIWTASLNKKGYGQFRVGRSMRLAHRVVYEVEVGSIPEGLELDHLCRTRACVRPDHLEPVTHAENIRRGETGITNRSKTHCPKGHPYDESNTYIPPGGDGSKRACRACLGCRPLELGRVREFV